MTFAFTPPAVSAVPVEGSAQLFPIHRIYCVGRNYAAHAREMGVDPDREPPFFFLKPADAIVIDPATLRYPVATKNYHYEMELVVAIGRGGCEISSATALEHVYGYAAGLDMTRRDLQLNAREAGRPWDMGKAFDASAPCSAIRPAAAIGHPSKGAIWLKVNGVTKQSSDLAVQIWPVADIISHLSRLVTLRPGDLIYTGTPEGVGPVVAGDKIEGHIERVGDLSLAIAAAV